jgi:hypothetical protein
MHGNMNVKFNKAYASFRIILGHIKKKCAFCERMFKFFLKELFI